MCYEPLKNGCSLRLPCPGYTTNRRGFTIRLKRLKPRAPNVGGPQNLRSKDNFQRLCKQLYFYFGSTHVFSLSANKRSLQKNERKGLKWLAMSILFLWRWELLLLRITCGTKRLNPLCRLHEAIEVLNKYVMGVWSDSFTAAFFVSFIVIVFVPDIEGIQNKLICLWIGAAYSVNVMSMCSANLYDISRRKPSRMAPNLK